MLYVIVRDVNGRARDQLTSQYVNRFHAYLNVFNYYAMFCNVSSILELADTFKRPVRIKFCANLLLGSMLLMSILYIEHDFERQIGFKASRTNHHRKTIKYF